jgi:hypothetical protein
LRNWSTPTGTMDEVVSKPDGTTEKRSEKMYSVKFVLSQPKQKVKPDNAAADNVNEQDTTTSGGTSDSLAINALPTADTIEPENSSEAQVDEVTTRRRCSDTIHRAIA